LRQRDQVLRKSESEMDSLNFRNQQLAKRVEILQEELEKAKIRETAGKKSSHHAHLKDQGKYRAKKTCLHFYDSLFFNYTRVSLSVQ